MLQLFLTVFTNIKCGFRSSYVKYVCSSDQQFQESMALNDLEIHKSSEAVSLKILRLYDLSAESTGHPLIIRYNDSSSAYCTLAS